MLSESNDPRPKPEKALLIGVETEEVGKAEAGHLLAELKGLATSLAPDGVRANCIVPGVMLTEEVAASDRAADFTRRGVYIPVGRVGEGWEIGPLAVLLASDESRYITGEAIEIDGGGLAGGLAPVGWDVAAQSRRAP